MWGMQLMLLKVCLSLLSTWAMWSHKNAAALLFKKYVHWHADIKTYKARGAGFVTSVLLRWLKAGHGHLMAAC